MAKRTLKPCKDHPCNTNIEIGEFLTVCSRCYLSSEEVTHWSEMPRGEKRLASKFAKKRKKYFERLRMREKGGK